MTPAATGPDAVARHLPGQGDSVAFPLPLAKDRPRIAWRDRPADKITRNLNAIRGADLAAPERVQ